MTYSEFLEFISNGIQLFYNTLIQVSNSLIHNYFFITILGLVLFSSLFWWFYYNVVVAPLKVKDNCDKWVDLKRNYKQFNDMKLNYISTNDYDVRLLNYANLKINRELYSHFLSNEKDLALSLSYKSIDLKNEASRLLNEKRKNDLRIKFFSEYIESISPKRTRDDDIFDEWEHKLKNKPITTQNDIDDMTNIINNF